MGETASPLVWEILLTTALQASLTQMCQVSRGERGLTRAVLTTWTTLGLSHWREFSGLWLSRRDLLLPRDTHVKCLTWYYLNGIW